MITSIKITDNQNTPLYYLKDIPFFENGRTMEFKPGVNIIVGSNGCGKSTTLKLIEYYTLCRKSYFSKFDTNQYSHIYLTDLFKDKFSLKDEDKKEVMNGVKIMADYETNIFRTFGHEDIDNDMCLNNIAFLSQWLDGKSVSKGQSTIKSLICAIREMNSDNGNRLWIDVMKEKFNDVNDTYKDFFNSYFRYIEDNKVKVETVEGKNGRIIPRTILLDEPDKGLDIQYITQLYKQVLGKKLIETQIIAIIHNPLLIYKLSKNKNVNIIEMTEGYVDKIKKFIGK